VGSPDTYRVLALGDSTTFGWGVPLEDTLPKQLETQLRQSRGSAKIEVVNAGTPTYGPWQSLDWLRERGKEFQPDAVIFSLFPVNDAGNELYLVGKQLRCYAPEGIALMRRFQRALFWPERLDAWLYSHSRFYQLCINARLNEEHPLLRITSQLRVMQG